MMTDPEQIRLEHQRIDMSLVRSRYIQAMLLGLLLAVVATSVSFGIWAFFRLSSGQGITARLTMSDIVLESPDKLCPGDTLTVSFDAMLTGIGILQIDAITYRVEPQGTVVFSTPKRTIMTGTPRLRRVFDSWRVPAGYINEKTGLMEPLPAGEYQRIISFSSAQINNLFAYQSVNFWIKPDSECPEKDVRSPQERILSWMAALLVTQY